MAEPHLMLRPVPGVPRQVVVGWMADTRPIDIHLGDGTVLRQANPDRMYEHTYAHDLDYSVAVRIEGLPEPLVGWAAVRVRAEAAPTLRIEQPDPDNPYRVRFVEPHPAGSPVSHWDVHFAQGGDESVLAVPLAPGQWVEHPYPAGAYEPRIREVETGRRNTLTLTVTDPVHDPDFTLSADSADVTLLVTAARPDSAALVSWGDGGPAEQHPLAVGTRLTHTFPRPDLYLVQAGYPGSPPTAHQITTHSGGSR